MGILAAAGAAKSLPDTDGQTPLHVAMRHDQAAAAAALVAAGAERSKANRWGATPLHVAATWGAAGAAAAVVGPAGFVDLNQLDAKTRTALFVAAVKGHADVARVLVAAGAGLNLFEHSDDLTPLHAAAVRAYTDVAKVLVGAGCNPDLPDKSNGYTPLHAAATRGHVATVKVTQPRPHLSHAAPALSSSCTPVYSRLRCSLVPLHRLHR